MQLEVQICSYGRDGLDRLAQMNLPHVKNVAYTVCLQWESDLPPVIPVQLEREDVKVLFHASKGLSANRNFGLRHATGDIILIADDDLVYDEDGLNAVIRAFQDNPAIDFATFMFQGPSGKKYPGRSFSFSDGIPKGYFLTSFELALRRRSLPEHIRFSELLGVGTPLFGSGEENVFLMHLVGCGLNGRFFPTIIVQHPGPTSGSKKATEEFLRSQGLWLRLRFGNARGLMQLVRNIPRYNAPMLFSFKHLIEGYRLMPKYFNADGSEKA